MCVCACVWLQDVKLTEGACQVILEKAGLTGWRLARSRVFLRYYHEQSLQLLLKAMEDSAILIQRTFRGHRARKRSVFTYTYFYSSSIPLLDPWRLRCIFLCVLCDFYEFYTIVQFPQSGQENVRGYKVSIPIFLMAYGLCPVHAVCRFS